MSRPVVRENAAPAELRETLWLRIEKLRRSRSSGAFGIAEIAGLAAAAVILLAVVFAYFFILTPADSQLAALQSERARLQKQLSSYEADVTRNMDTQAAVEKISESLDRFENEQLTGLTQGRTALYSELDSLIRRNGLRNTGGISYVPLESLGAVAGTENGAAPSSQPSAGGNRAGNAKWQSIYPGVGVRMTIAGQYQNVRHFLRDIETSRKYLVINSVNLESVTDTLASTQVSTPLSTAGSTTVSRGPAETPLSGRPSRLGRTAAPRVTEAGPGATLETPTPGSPRTSLVSLTVDMAAYFQRQGALQAPTASVSATR